MSRKKKLRLGIWAGIFLLLALSLLWIYRPESKSGHAFATISVGETAIKTIDLTEAPDQEFSIEAETGLAITFQIRDHAIRFFSSDCPDKICINTGFLKNDLDVASCLPNRTSVLISVEP